MPTYIHLEELGDQEYFSLIPTIDSLDKYSDVGFLKYTWRLKGLKVERRLLNQNLICTRRHLHSDTMVRYLSYLG